jgi:lysozyme
MGGGFLRQALLSAAIVCLAALVAWPAQAANPYPRKSDSDPHEGVITAKRMAVQGIDVSKYQLEIDWREVKKAGTRFAFIKATEGGDLLDSRFRDNWAESRAAGVPRGAYHFVFWCRPAKDQIRWFMRHVPKDPDALPPVLDVEWSHKTSCPRPSADRARAKMREMLRAFEAHYGKKPIIYTDINFHEDVLDGTTEFNDYPFWIRSVAAKPKERYGNREWEFWQFTATGRVPGIPVDVDRNAFYGSDKQFRDWIEGRYDIGARKATQNQVARSGAGEAPSGSAAARPGAAAPARPAAEPAQPPPQRQDAAEADPRIAPAEYRPRIAPVRPDIRRREPSRLIPPGVVPDVTGSIGR